MIKYERQNCYEVGDTVKLKSSSELKLLPNELLYCRIEDAGKDVVVTKVINGTNNWYEFDGIEGAWSHQAIVGSLV